MAAQPVYCGTCGTANAAGTAFCGGCGRPLAAAATPAYAYAYAPATPQQYAAAQPSRSHLLIWLLAAAGVGLFMICLAAIAVLFVVRPPANPTCPPSCAPPPPRLAPPLGPQHAFSSSKYGWSLAYADKVAGNALTIAGQSETGIQFKIGSFPVGFEAEPASGRSAQQIAEALHQKTLPQATFVYALPGAEMGYNPGYGAVYDTTVQTANGQSLHVRMIIEVAIKKDLAIELVEIGPFQQTVPKDGFPNPADTIIVFLTSGIVNTVTFPGDPVL